MTLTLRPKGRGKWSTVTVEITGKRAAPMLWKVGDEFPMKGIVFRVVEVKA